MTTTETIYNFSQYYDPILPVNVTIAGRSYCDSSYSISRTNSDILSFEYIIEGEGTLQINGNTLYPKKGDVYLLKKGSNHHYYTTKTDNPWVKVWVVFCGDFAQSIFDQYIPKDCYLVEGCNVLTYMNELLYLLQSSDSYPDKMDQSAVILLRIAQVIKSHITDTNGTLSKTPALRIQRYINSNINRSLTLDDIAHEFSYSKNQIINIFKQQFGVTPYQYYKQKRVNSAKQYLTDTALSIKEISDIMNFPDRHYFANFIKDNLGEYPNKIRKG